MTSDTDSSPGPPSGGERRSNPTLRKQVHELLGLIREFYQTCHMVAVGQLEPSRAKTKARSLEEKLRVMMGDMLADIEDSDGGDSTPGGASDG